MFAPERKMTPPAMNPTPVTTPATIRVVSLELSSESRSAKSADPTATKLLV